MAKETPAAYRPRHPLLIGSSFERTSEVAEDDDETINSLDCSIAIYRKYDSTLRLAQCEFAASEKLRAKPDSENKDDVLLYEIKANYIVAVEVVGKEYPSNEQLKRMFLDVSQSTAWVLFRSYFATVTSQANLTQDALPLVPDINVSFDEDEETK